MAITDPNATAGPTASREYPAIDSLCLELKRVLPSLEPSAEVCQHFRNARIEVLKGLRQMIDNRIENLDRKGEAGRKIAVE